MVMIAIAALITVSNIARNLVRFQFKTIPTFDWYFTDFRGVHGKVDLATFKLRTQCEQLQCSSMTDALIIQSLHPHTPPLSILVRIVIFMIEEIRLEPGAAYHFSIKPSNLWQNGKWRLNDDNEWINK